MTRQEAIQALKEGKKVTHRHFNPDEYITYRDGRIRDEADNRLGSISDFMMFRQNPTFETDWEIYQ
jgi:hypothetical protein